MTYETQTSSRLQQEFRYRVCSGLFLDRLSSELWPGLFGPPPYKSHIEGSLIRPDLVVVALVQSGEERWGNVLKDVIVVGASAAPAWF